MRYHRFSHLQFGLFCLSLCGVLFWSIAGCSSSTSETPSGDPATASSEEKQSAAEEESTEAPATDEPAPDAPTDEAARAAANEPEEDHIGDLQALPDSVINQTKVLLGSPDLTSGIPGKGPLTIEEITAWLNDSRNMEPLDIELPLGLAAGAGQIKGLDANPLTRAKIELGRQLYFDPRLSADGTISCASCHDPEQGWAKQTQFGVGIRGQEGGRNSPVSFNRILSDKQFWDGRAGTLEEQAVGPIQNPIEMGNTHEQCVKTIEAIPGYKLQFDRIFGETSIENIGKAIASFERAVVTASSPADYYEQLRPFLSMDLDELKEDDPEVYAAYVKAKEEADAHPMSESAIRGRDIYFSDKGGCSACHVGANMTDELYWNLGVGMDKETPDLGRYEQTQQDKDRGAFKTPTIRNVELTAPYMHDGSQKTLEEVVEWYAKGGHPNPYLSTEKVKKLNLTDQDKKDLVEFLKACTGAFPPVETGRLPE